MTKLAEAFDRAIDPTTAGMQCTSMEGDVGDWPEDLTIDDPCAGERPTAAYARQGAALSPGRVGSRRRARTLDALSEQFRRLAAALHHLQQTRGAHTVVVGSAIGGEGKTVTAVNLAFMLSRSYQRRVLLIDADLRRPSVHNILQLSNQTGLGTIFGDPEIRALPIVHVSPTLSVLTAGPAMSDPSSFLISDVLRQLLAEAAQVFDWVVLDTSPVVLFPDASLLAALADIALLVVGARSTPYPLVRQAIELIGRRRLLGIVLNRIGKKEAGETNGFFPPIPHAVSIS